MTTVKELKKALENMPDDYEVLIYPKYSSDDVDGVRKHSFKPENVCLQEPYAIRLKDDPAKLNEYFGGKKPKPYDLTKHVAIIF